MNYQNKEQAYKYNIKLVHINYIKIGDVIVHSDGKHYTLNNENIKNDSFIGKTILGDSYKLGYELVKFVEIIHVQSS
jgi:hypothetical protein